MMFILTQTALCRRCRKFLVLEDFVHLYVRPGKVLLLCCGGMCVHHEAIFFAVMQNLRILKATAVQT